MPSGYRLPTNLIPYSQEWFEYGSMFMTRIMSSKSTANPKNGREDIGECWISKLKSQNYNGYTRVGFLKNTVGLHRIALTIASGKPPQPNMSAAHSCGTRKCFNPTHLSWKTHTENQRDRFGDGTHMRGRKPKNSVSTSQYVGVCKSGKIWTSSIKMNGKTKYVGSYRTEEDAALAYNEVATRLNSNMTNPRSHYRLNTVNENIQKT